MNEQALLDAIRAAPYDEALRLVYADWLEERGDARGELVRVEEEMRQLPAFSDRFWQLKPRRNELRALAAAEWLEAMRYGTDVWPLFGHGVPDGWRERWRLAREMVERWHGRPMPDTGGRSEEVREVEERLGRALPPSLREWVAFAHDVGVSDEHPCLIRDVYQMQELAGHVAVSLLLQGEGDYHWAVRHEDFGLPDPPVYGFLLDFDGGDEDTFVPDERSPVNESVSSFALSYVLGYTRGTGGGFGARVGGPALLIHELEAAFPAQGRFGEVRFFEDDNILVRLSPLPEAPGVRLVVEVAGGMPREGVPAFLWGCRGGGWSHGMFDPGIIPAPPPSGDGDDEIPF